MYRRCILALLFCTSLRAENFIVKPAKKKPAKITMEQCSHEILDHLKIFSVCAHYSSAIELLELHWIEDMLNNVKDSFRQEDMEQFITQSKKLKAAHEEYVKELKAMHTMLAQVKNK